MNPQDLAQKLAQALPQVVDRLTPHGVVPQGDEGRGFNHQ